MSKLVIVESPAKAKTINKYLGNEFIVDASMGHIRDLPQKTMGIDVNNDFAPAYEIIEGKEDKVNRLKSLAKKADTVYLASDPDREGEAIAWHLEYLLKNECSNIYRVEFHEITKKAVNEAIQTPHKIDLHMVNAQQTRRILDRIVGYEVSPFLWKKVKRGLSAGRVQSVVVRIIVDREREIENFQPKEYWTITAVLEPLGVKQSFESKLSYVIKDGRREKFEIGTKEDAKKVVDAIKSQIFKVTSVVAKPKNKKPFAPFTTSVIQQESSRKLNYVSTKTMKIAQELYEGVELGEKGSMGLITYMRTDSTRISDDFQIETLQYIKKEYGDKYAPEIPQKYQTKGGAQDAHEAIRPTSLANKPEDIKKYLTDEQYKLYKLIWDRFIASQMADAVYDTVDLEIQVLNYVFKTTGSTLKFNGFLAVYNEDKDEDGEEDEKAIPIPKVSEGDIMRLVKLNDKQNFTKPPSPFTEPTLIKELEKKGIGRPSTYATIISTIQKKERAYVEKKGKKFVSTELGKAVNDLLVRCFPDIMDITFTSEMESYLDEVSEGKKHYINVLKEFYQKFEVELKNAVSETDKVQLGELTDILCEKCQKPMIKKSGKYGEYLSCSGFPECKNIVSLKQSNAEETDKVCPGCSSKMVIRTSKTGGKFYACTGFPKCKHTEPHESSISDKKCPKCGKDLVKRSYKKGRTIKEFWGCSGYPQCDFTEWIEDEKNKTGKVCPKCGGELITKSYKDKNDGKTKKFLGCSNYPNCQYTEFPKDNKKDAKKGK